jgi:hypothetical protein
VRCRRSVGGCVLRISRRRTPSPLNAPDKFLYVFKTGPFRARKRAATAGRPACPPLRFAAFWARTLAWRARANRVPGRRQLARHQRSTTCRCTAHLDRPANPPWGRALPPSNRGLPDRPDSNVGKVRPGPARVKGACGVAPRSSKLAPGHALFRTSGGSYRDDPADWPRLTRRCQALRSSKTSRRQFIDDDGLSPTADGPVVVPRALTEASIYALKGKSGVRFLASWPYGRSASLKVFLV